MNSRNYTYIRTLLNGSYVTDEILNRIFCLKEGEDPRPDAQWCFLDDEKAKEIAKWIKSTDRRVNSEKLKAKLRARYARKISEGSRQSS
jgi:hypothetical protein